CDRVIRDSALTSRVTASNSSSARRASSRSVECSRRYARRRSRAWKTSWVASAYSPTSSLSSTSSSSTHPYCQVPGQRSAAGEASLPPVAAPDERDRHVPARAHLQLPPQPLHVALGRPLGDAQ